ncbi:MAG: helix-turn-helix domain-containing protein [Thermoanaerobaculia bacterium]
MPVESPQEFGEELRRERELREVTREQLADVTKVSVRQIEALEAGRFELLPARVFARGFVLALARHLGLDAERTAAAFNHVHEGWSAEREKSAASTSTTASSDRIRLSRPRRNVSLNTTALGVGVALLLAVLTGVAAILKGKPGAPSGDVARSEAPPEVATPVPEALHLPPAVAAATVPVSSETPLVEPAVARPAPQPGAAPAAGGRVLTLTFSEDCWTEVSVDGRVVAAELYRKGTTRRFEGGRTFVLTLGNAGGVTVDVDGAPLGAVGQLGQVVKNFVIGDSKTATPQGG